MKCVCAHSHACACVRAYMCAVSTVLFLKWLKLPLSSDLCSHPWGLFLELISTPTNKQDEQGHKKRGIYKESPCGSPADNPAHTSPL